MSYLHEWSQIYLLAYNCLYLNKYLMHILGVLIERTVSHPMPFGISSSIPIVVGVVGNFFLKVAG